MLLTMIPVTVMAETTEIMVNGISYQLNSTGLQSAIDSAGNGDTVRLGGNIVLGDAGVIVSSDIEKSIYLDLNGYTITYSGTDSAVKISGSASLTVHDSSTVNTTGKITSASNCRIIRNTGSGTLTFESGTIEGTGTTYGIYNEGSGKLFITGGTVQTTDRSALWIDTNSGDVEISSGTLSTSNWETIKHYGENAKLTIKDDAFIECKKTGGNSINTASGSFDDAAGLIIQGGIIKGTYIFVQSDTYHVEINGGYRYRSAIFELRHFYRSEYMVQSRLKKPYLKRRANARRFLFARYQILRDAKLNLL